MNTSLIGKNKKLLSTTAGVIMAFSGSLWSAPLKLAVLDTPESTTKAYMLKHILEEKTDYKVELVSMTKDQQWPAITSGEIDASVSVVLPDQKNSFEQYRTKVEDLGPNWISKENTVHTIVRPSLVQEDVPLVRFLNNYCLCGERLASAQALLKNNKVTRKDANSWMNEHQIWLHNMMGFVREQDDREDKDATY